MIRARHLLIHLVLAVAIGWTASYYVGVSPWIGIIVTSLALQLVGWIATWEDERPGGFNNPAGTNRDNAE